MENGNFKIICLFWLSIILILFYINYLLIQAVLDLALEVFTEGRDEKVMDILQLPLHPDAFDEISKPTVTTSCYFFQAAKHLYNAIMYICKDTSSTERGHVVGY